MAEENGPEVDLLGDPWTPPRDPRGRKRHKRVAQIAENVAVLRGCGLTEEQIAARVGLSEPTLRKYYFRELKDGPTLAKAVLTEAVWKRAKAGNVSAARYLRTEFEKGDAAVPVPRQPRQAKAPEPGKKEAADLAARTAHEGTEWGTLLKH